MRIIDADLLYKALSEETIHRMQHSNGSNFDIGRTNGIIYSRDMIKNVPAIEPVKRGKWTHEIGENFRTCSNCKISMGMDFYEILERFNFCPHCGADMRTEP